jgi:hypothetical protein
MERRWTVVRVAGVLWWIGVISVAFGTAGVVVAGVDALSGDRPHLEIVAKTDAGYLYRGDERALPVNAERRGMSYVRELPGAQWRIMDPHPVAVVAWMLDGLLPWLLGALTLLVLRPLLRGTQAGSPFRPGIVRRLSRLGWLLIIAVPVHELLQAIVVASITYSAGFEMPSPSFTLSALMFAPGVAALVLAGVFQRGVELQDQDALTV